MEDRSWAVGLEQIIFEREYLKRWPGADVIPFGAEWVEATEVPSRLIDSPDPEKFEVDGPKEETDKRKIPGQFVCKGCGLSFTFRIARSGHQNGCEKYKALKNAEKEEAE